MNSRKDKVFKWTRGSTISDLPSANHSIPSFLKAQQNRQSSGSGFVFTCLSKRGIVPLSPLSPVFLCILKRKNKPVCRWIHDLVLNWLMHLIDHNHSKYSTPSTYQDSAFRAFSVYRTGLGKFLLVGYCLKRQSQTTMLSTAAFISGWFIFLYSNHLLRFSSSKPLRFPSWDGICPVKTLFSTT